MNYKFAPYSKSRIDASDCPWAFANIYIGRDLLVHGKEYVEEKYAGLKYKLVKPDNEDQINLIFGSVAHEIAEEIINIKSEKRDFNEEMIADVIDKHMKEQIVHGPQGFNYPTMQKVVERFLRNYDYDPEYLVGTEIELGITADGEPCEYSDPKCFARAKLDVLEIDFDSGHGRVTDHKTQMNIVEAEDNDQLCLYGDILLANYKMLDRVTMRLNFCRWGAFRSAEYTREEAAKLRRAVMAKVKSIEERTNFIQARRCAYCDICRYRVTHCPMLKAEKRRKIKTPTSWHDAKKLLEISIGFDAQLSHIKDLLKDWCSKNGTAISVPMRLDEKSDKNKFGTLICMGYRESESISYESEDIKSLCDKYKLNSDQYLLTDNKKLNRIFNVKKAIKEIFPNPGQEQARNEFMMELDTLKKKQTKVRFDKYKAKIDRS